MSAITTHILDTSLGQPAAGVSVELEYLSDGEWVGAGKGETNDDGRVKDLLKEDFKFQPGRYRIAFSVEDYFRKQSRDSFYPYVKIVFEVKDASAHYHVPLLLNPFGYSTYRGS